MKQLAGIFFLILISLFSSPAKAQIVAGEDSSQMDYANPQQYEIKDIRQSEDTRLVTLDWKSLVARTGLQPGQTISIPGDAITKAIQNLWKLRLFSDVEIYAIKIEGKYITLGIRLQELPRISSYSPSGLSKSEFEDIQKRVDIVGGVTPYNDYIKKSIESTVKEYFADKGYLRTTVEVYAKPDTARNNSVILFFDVTKGPKVKIDEITFNGNEEISDRVLKHRMKDTKERFQINPLHNDPDHPWSWSWLKPSSIVHTLSNMTYGSVLDFASDKVRFHLFSPSKYNPDKMTTDEYTVVKYYNAKGYRDAQIIADTAYYVDDRDLRINITLDEGKKYYFRNIFWRGNTKYTTGRLDSILGIKKGDVYNQTLLNQKLNYDPNGGLDISSLYMDDGYLFFHVTPVEVLVEGDSIDLEIRMQEGPQATIAQVIIKGNTKTNEHVIRRELRTLPGQKFSRSDLIRSEREIANLGFFDPEQIGVNPIPHPENGTVDVEYTVVEKPSDQLELSAGFGGQGYGILASVGIVLNNWSTAQMFKKDGWKPLPTGDGQQLSFRINTTGRLYQSFNIGFVEPWLGGKKPHSLSVSFFRTLQSRNDYGTSIDELEGHFLANGATVGYGVRLKWPDNYFTLQSSVNYFNYDLNNWTGFIITDGISNNFSLKETLARNSIDNPQFPRSGSSLSLSLQVTPPYSLLNGKDYSDLSDQEKYKFIEYHKWRFNADWYTPLFGKFVLRSSVKFGYLGYYNADIGTSPFERFQLGGDGLSGYSNVYIGTDIISLRGYNVLTNSAGTTRTEPVFTKYTLEMRYPVSLNPSATIYAMAFAEGGNLWPDLASFNPFEVKRSVGLGMRFFLPMFGLLGVDYGIRFDDGVPGDLQDTHGFFDYIGKNGKFSIILGFEPE